MQRFKGRKLTKSKVIKNILQVYNDTTVEADGSWYRDANNLAKTLAAKYNVSELQAAGVIAALSPLKSWNENKRIAEEFLRSGKCLHTGLLKDKAKEILRYEGVYEREYILNSLNGNKIQAFFLNIAFPNLNISVTIDRHAIAVGLGRNAKDTELKGITDKQYYFFEACYIEAANKVGILPQEMQAITWVKWRQLKKQEQFAEVPF